MKYLIILIVIVIIVVIWKKAFKKKGPVTPQKTFPEDWKLILAKNVAFYNSLNPEEKKNFEFRVYKFLLNCRIVGVKTQIDITDKLLIGASAIIPIFKFPNWEYRNLDEILVFSDTFNKKFQVTGPDRNILGVVGEGILDGKMLISKKAIHNGFDNDTDRKNTAIHEFIHLIDKLDGNVDGIPRVLIQYPNTIPWIDIISQKIEDINAQTTDINPYGATNKAEFFAVISEYFFENPQLLKQKHPVVYEQLEIIFKHDLSKRKLEKKYNHLGRNSDCPCGSGEKFKNCCLNNSVTNTDI